MHDLNLGESEKQVLYPLYKKLRETLVNLKREAVGSVLSIAHLTKKKVKRKRNEEEEEEEEFKFSKYVNIFVMKEDFAKHCIRKSVLILHQVNTECIVICII